MAVSEKELLEYAVDLAKLGLPKKLIEDMVHVKKLDLPAATPSLYKGLERYYDYMREDLLLSLVKSCVGKKIGKRFKDTGSAVRHIKVCLQCQAEIINFVEKIKQEFNLIQQ